MKRQLKIIEFCESMVVIYIHDIALANINQQVLEDPPHMSVTLVHNTIVQINECCISSESLNKPQKNCKYSEKFEHRNWFK